MPGEWKTSRIGDCFDLVNGYAFKSDEFIESGIPVIKIKNVKANRMLFDDLSYVAHEFLKTRADKVVQKGDLLITMSGNRFDGSPDTWVGKVAQFNESRPFLLNQRVGILRPKKGAEVDRRFFSFSLSSHFYQTEFISIATSSGGQANLSPSQILGAPIEYPLLPEQIAIASVLGALDDKIELNRRMNATLEAMARALFQSWFVDFDPVRAKLDGRPPAALDQATAAFFPEHLEDSPLGHIPKGWKAGTVIEGFNLTMGQSPPGDTYNEEGNGLPFYQGRTDFGFRFPTRRIYCSAPTRYAKPGDTLVSVRAPVGDINMAIEECSIGRGVAAVRHKSGATSFTYHSIANLYPDFARFEAEGTVFGSINKDSFEKLPFVIPPTEIIAAYERQAGPLDEQIRALENQSRTLATLRDTLLPKLLSGELHAGTEKIMGGSA